MLRAPYPLDEEVSGLNTLRLLCLRFLFTFDNVLFLFLFLYTWKHHGQCLEVTRFELRKVKECAE